MRKTIAIALVLILVSIITVLFKNKGNPKDTIVCSSTCSLQGTFSNKVLEKKEADYYVNEILSSLLIQKKENFFEDITVIPGDVSTLTAAKSAGNLFIIYNPDYVNSLRKGVNGDMMLKGVFAHMIAHHMLSHKESQEDYNYNNEYHADKYAGSMMYSFIKDSEQATNLFYSIANEFASNNQVSKNRRITAMLDGWKSESKPPKEPDTLYRDTIPPIEIEDITAFLDDWVAAQIQNDFDRYKEMYYYNFTGVKMNFNQKETSYNYGDWLNDKRTTFPYIQIVRYDELSILDRNENNARIRFTQVFLSFNYGDKGIKEMTLKRENGKLSITNEEMKSSKRISNL